MAEYTCSVCDERFDEEEKELTNDESKCILHCDKKDNFTSKSKIEYFKNKIYNLLIGQEVYTFVKVVFPNFNMKEWDSYSVKFSFEECIFYCNIDTNVDIYYFYKCIFYNNISLLENNKTDKYLFGRCTFFGTIHLGHGEYKNPIFSYCKFENKSTLISENAKFKADIFETMQGEYPSSITLYDSEFSGKFNIQDSNAKLNIHIENCIYDEEFSIYECKNVQTVFVVNSYFNKTLYISNNIIKDLNISQLEIKELSVLGGNNIKKLFCSNVTFQNFISFRKNVFESDVNLSNVNFLKKVSFIDSVIKGSFNLRDTLFYDEAHFIDISKYEDKLIPVTVDNRETARKIKDSFEQQNNIIEANRYYAVEMKEREKELEVTKSKNWFEWLIFKVQEVSSNHSQDALLALFWICVVGVFASYFSFYTIQDKMGNYVHFNLLPFLATMALSFSIIGCKYIFKRLEKMYYYFVFVFFPLLYYYTTNDSWFTLFANTINPFSIMTKGETLNLGMLIFKVIIAYLIYQFIVSVRQNTRRK